MIPHGATHAKTHNTATVNKSVQEQAHTICNLESFPNTFRQTWYENRMSHTHNLLTLKTVRQTLYHTTKPMSLR